MIESKFKNIYREIQHKASHIDSVVLRLCQGLTWTSCVTQNSHETSIGFAQSPGLLNRTLPWPGSLAGKKINELSSWLSAWDFHQATVGLAVCNSVINTSTNVLMQNAIPIKNDGPQNLAIFNYFKPKLKNKKVVIVGRYPGLENALEGIDYTVLERQPSGNDFPDSAAEYLLPDADWVFITATSLINKTFPRLAELSENAVSVLMGPSTPWLEEFANYGIDFVAGVKPLSLQTAEQVVMEGGGTRLFDIGVQYALADISQARMENLRSQISQTVLDRQLLKDEMETWYDQGKGLKFPGRSQLESTDKKLSWLDSGYKRLWDAHH